MSLKIKIMFAACAVFCCALACAAFVQNYAANESEKTERDGAKGFGHAGTGTEGGQDGLFLETEERLPETGTEEAAQEKKEDSLSDEAERLLSFMTLEEKIAQMFVITPEAHAGAGSEASAGEAAREAMRQYPVGGLIYFAGNIRSKEQVTEMIRAQQQFSMERTGLPLFISVDEEGGSVARVANDSPVPVAHFPDMVEIGAAEDALFQAGRLGSEIGSYLGEMGFNLDFAPVADVWTNPANAVVRRRSFGTDAKKVSELSSAVLTGLQEQGVYGCLKHFPGHGATAQDSHDGFASTDKTLEELKEAELVPFQEGIAAGASFIMAGHISAPNVSGDDLPATLSPVLLTGVLREEMQFDGIIITDAMNMGAVTGRYGAGEAAELAVLAGADMILMPADFKEACRQLLNAVEKGRIKEERIDASARRILERKLAIKGRVAAGAR